MNDHPDAAAQPPPPRPPSSGAGFPSQQWNGPGQPVSTPPERKGTNPVVVILAVVGSLFVLGLGGCAAAAVVATLAVGDAIDDASDNISEVTDGIEDGALGELLEGEGSLGELLDEEGGLGELLDEEGGIGGLLDEAAGFAACIETVDNIENQAAGGQLDLIDQAIEQCGTLSILELALAQNTQLLDDGQTMRELIEGRCAAPDSGLSTTPICEEVGGLR